MPATVWREGMRVEHSYLTELLAADPSLAGHEVAVIGGGENNTVVEVGGEYVFRFPRNETALERLQAEAALLVRIAPHAPVPIPVVTHLCADAPLGRAHMGYRKLPGRPLSRDFWTEMSVPQQANIAAVLGRFLMWLHGQQGDTIGEIALPRVGGLGYWEALNACFEERLFAHMSHAGRDQVSALYHAFVAGPGAVDTPACLVHGDFGPSNILYDSGLWSAFRNHRLWLVRVGRSSGRHSGARRAGRIPRCRRAGGV
jgi:aminoglycoside 2''-phosphotransferase